MKKVIIFSTIALAVLATSCSNDDERFFSREIGRVTMLPEIKSDIEVVGRSSATEADLDESLIFWISNSKGPVRKYKGKANLPAEDWLVAGHYVAEAWAGDSVSASFEDRWFKGAAEFDVRGGEVTPVNVPCKIANVLVDVDYADGLTDYFSQYGVDVSHARGSLTFDGAEQRTGYFMMPSTDKNLAWKFEATTNSGETITRQGVINNAKPATKYIINIKFDPTGSDTGGSFFDIVVDVTERIVYDDFVLELAPIVKGVGFDINEELLAKPGEVGRRSVIVGGSGELTNVELSMPGFSALLGITSPSGSSFDEFNLIGLDQTFEQRLLGAGIQGLYNYDSESGASSMKINFGDAFTNKLTVGKYVINISSIDSKGRETSTDFVINVSNDPLQINAVNDYDVWATSATISATALRDDCGTPALQYRRHGSGEWINAEYTSAGGVYTAAINGLTPATTYEYRVSSDAEGGFASEIKTFTTETAAQLENAGFENWNTTGKAYLLYADGTQMFWDSGNHGSATLNTNITTPDEDLKHSGSYSVKMSSQKVSFLGIGKFAAGNAFIGQYLATEGTDGQLGWGRPFASRPKALKGYVKYSPVAVTDANGGELSKGDMDNGIIYIAILDGTTKAADAADNNYVSGVTQKNWPVIVKTKSSKLQLFSKNDANVIAYGEMVFTQATAGEGLIEFEIPIEYFKTDIKASNIMVTMSASRWGDYFTGGDGSTMWVDDLQLVY